MFEIREDFDRKKYSFLWTQTVPGMRRWKQKEDEE